MHTRSYHSTRMAEKNSTRNHSCVSAFAHGFAGDRFFPATISTDDPFAASELSLPTFSEIRQPGQPPVKVFDISTDISLLVLPRTALTIGDGSSIKKVASRRALTGFDNVSVICPIICLSLDHSLSLEHLAYLFRQGCVTKASPSIL
jgi:hypothetical protein